MTDPSLARRLNALSDADARAALQQCCASSRWTEAMVVARPFASDAAVLAAAERAWWALGPEDWREAFAAHPRIGESASADPRHAPTREWSRQEQAGAATVDAAVRAELAAGNAEYERRFGRVFLIRAAGRSAEEMLAELRRRLGNDPDAELREAAGELAGITRRRLERLAAP